MVGTPSHVHSQTYGVFLTRPHVSRTRFLLSRPKWSLPIWCHICQMCQMEIQQKLPKATKMSYASDRSDSYYFWLDINNETSKSYLIVSTKFYHLPVGRQHRSIKGLLMNGAKLKDRNSAFTMQTDIYI